MLPLLRSEHTCLFWIYFGLLFLVMTIVPIWVALKARPLGTRAYRWATWLAIETGLVSVLVFALSAPIITKRGLDAGASLYLLLGVLGLIGAIGLFRRKRVGVVFVIASELYLLILSPLMAAMYRHQTTTNQSGNAFPLLIVVVANFFYFRKRWTVMEPGLS